MESAESGESRQRLLAELQSLMRQHSLRVLLLQQAVAERLNLNTTDQNCLQLIIQSQPLTPGRLGQLTGLTSGAITGVLDRLERAGFVRREHDSQDRRRVLVCALPEKADSELAPLFRSLRKSWAELCAGYSDDQLHLLAGFFRQTEKLLEEETRKLKMVTPLRQGDRGEQQRDQGMDALASGPHLS